MKFITYFGLFTVGLFLGLTAERYCASFQKKPCVSECITWEEIRGLQRAVLDLRNRAPEIDIHIQQLQQSIGDLQQRVPKSSEVAPRKHLGCDH